MRSWSCCRGEPPAAGDLVAVGDLATVPAGGHGIGLVDAGRCERSDRAPANGGGGSCRTSRGWPTARRLAASRWPRCTSAPRRRGRSSPCRTTATGCNASWTCIGPMPSRAGLPARRGVSQRGLAGEPGHRHGLGDGLAGAARSRVENRLAYAHFQAQGWPIGFGAVESANDLVVEARLKGAEMRWARGHIDPLLALRCAACNDRWDQTWTQTPAPAHPAPPTSHAPLRPARALRRPSRPLRAPSPAAQTIAYSGPLTPPPHPHHSRRTANP